MKIIPDVTTVRGPYRAEDARHQLLDPRPFHPTSRTPRCARSPPKAEAYPRDDGHRRHRVPTSRRRRSSSSTTCASEPLGEQGYHIDSIEGRPGTPAAPKGRQQPQLQSAPLQGQLLPRRRSTTPRRPPRQMVLDLETGRPRGRARAHRGRFASQAGDQLHRFDTLLQASRRRHAVQSTSSEHARVGRDARRVTFMPQPLFGDNSSGMHCTSRSWKDGSPLFYDEPGTAVSPDMARWYLGGLLQARAVAARASPTRR